MKSLAKKYYLINQTKDILGRYGFSHGFMTDEFSLRTRLSELKREAEKLGFELPSRNPLLLVHNLGERDFDSAYLYDIKGNPIAFNGGPTLNKINGLSRDLTKLFSDDTLISYYENDRFAIPVLTLWENGKIKSQSKNAGSEEYCEDYWFKDEEEYGKRIERNAPGLFKKRIKSLE